MSVSNLPNGRRALLIVHQYPPATSAGVFRTIRFAKYLPAFGWTPVVLTATPAGAGEVAGPSNSDCEHRAAVPTRIRVARVGGSRLSKETSSKQPSHESLTRSYRSGRRIRTLARNTWRLLTETPDRDARWVVPAVSRGLRLIRETRPDVLYTSGPPHSVHLAGAALKRFTGLPWIADFRDPWARRPWKKEGNPWGERLLGRFERECVRRANAVILNTVNAVADFRAAYPEERPGKFHVIPNGCDPDLVSRARELNGRIKRDTDSEFLLLHPGSCYGRRDPRVVVDALAALARRGIRAGFEQVGHCAPVFSLSEYAHQRGIGDRVSVESAISHDEILRRMARADALLLIQPEAPLMVPGKLYEMLPFRKPIIAMTDEGATAEIVRRFDLGTVLRSDDSEGLADSLARLNSQAGVTVAGTSGLDEALRVFDGKALTGQLAEVFDSMSCAEALTASGHFEVPTETQSTADIPHRTVLTSFPS